MVFEMVCAYRIGTLYAGKFLGEESGEKPKDEGDYETSDDYQPIQ
jgi:hypothetical protein